LFFCLWIFCLTNYASKLAGQGVFIYAIAGHADAQLGQGIKVGI
jgi:hypothetical protein